MRTADVEGQDVARLEAGGHASELLKAAQQESSARKEHDGERYLSGDEQPLHALPAGHLRTPAVRQAGGRKSLRVARTAGSRPHNRVTATAVASEYATILQSIRDLVDTRKVCGGRKKARAATPAISRPTAAPATASTAVSTIN